MFSGRAAQLEVFSGPAAHTGNRVALSGEAAYAGALYTLFFSWHKNSLSLYLSVPPGVKASQQSQRHLDTTNSPEIYFPFARLPSEESLANGRCGASRLRGLAR